MTPEFIVQIPYGIRYLGRVLWESLLKKFPDTTHKELLKIVAHFVYYRFIGACIVAPEVYGIIRMKPGEKLSNESRENLGQIHKMLHAASSCQKGFLSDMNLDFSHSLGVQTFITDAYEGFKEFFREVLMMERPEDYYEVTRFSDEAMIFPPQVTLKLKEVLDLHNWLYEMRKTIAPDPKDVFHDLLNDCGHPPNDVSDIIGSSSLPPGTLDKRSTLQLSPGRESKSKETAENYEITFRLKNKKSVSISPDEMSSKSKIRVMQAIIELIKLRTQCKDLNQVLFKEVTLPETESFKKYKDNLMKQKMDRELKNASIIFTPFGESLKTLLDFVRLNLKLINGCNFDEISGQIIQDIKNKMENREFLQAELDRMRTTLGALKEKKEHSEKVHNYYKQYLNQCLKQMDSVLKASKDDKSKSSKSKSRSQVKMIKYSAQKLLEKGVIKEVKTTVDRDKHDKKAAVSSAISLEISPSLEESGLFTIRIMIGGHEVEKVKIEIQYLLELQYRNKTTLDIGRMVINVDLMIYLLNKKFYSS